MVARADNWLRLSHCGGPGSDQFLSRALADPLEGGSRLADAGPVTRDGRIDFVLSRNGGESCEVVRVTVDERGRPTDVEVWLVSEAAPPRSYVDAQRLLSLVQGAPITAIAERAGAVMLSNAAGDTVALRGSDFRAQPGEG